MSKDIHRKLKHMTKYELEEICRKMKCYKGTKKEMIVNLLRPFTKKKYRMDSSDDEEYLYSDSEFEYLDQDVELSDSDDENDENDKKQKPKIIKKTRLKLDEEKIPEKYDDQFNVLLKYSLNADKTRRKPPYSREDLKLFLNDLKMIKNRHIIEDAYNRFKKYIKEWKNKGGFPNDPAIFIEYARNAYDQKRKRSRKIIDRYLGKYHKKRQKRKIEEDKKIKPTDAEIRRELFAQKYKELFSKK